MSCLPHPGPEAAPPEPGASTAEMTRLRSQPNMTVFVIDLQPRLQADWSSSVGAVTLWLRSTFGRSGASWVPVMMWCTVSAILVA
ncbi:hypothetical protein EL18_02244 [Nitratireductor basaltis]|uniref:Uncharacterized protein n=1 Tax=Nitratireductor basaltis TaxID=472175 RepID=A0A084UE13_9HYPH|nr:hypothetical protein EL18_02244 [Nitratireductor basaltis]